jgi:signal transduction histidine kinase
VELEEELKSPHQLDFVPLRKRRDRRFAVNQPARLSIPGVPQAVCEARILNISRRGIQFAVDWPIQGPNVRIEWNGREIYATARYQQPGRDGYRLGVELPSSWESLVSDVLAQHALELETANAALREQSDAHQRAGERLAAYAETLAGKNDEVCRALDAACQASVAKSRFLASVSHELRTPLNGIIGFAQMLYDGALGPVTDLQRECLGDMLSCSDHLLMLISHVLDLTKIECGKMTFQYEPVSLTRLVQEAIDTLRPIAKSKKIAIRFEPAPDFDTVQADPGRLRQILYNYLSNALKFTGDGGRIGVSYSAEERGFYRIDVEDSGKGMAADDLPRLFAEFRQVGGSEKSLVGSGLGLAITKRIAEAQGGRVGVTSELGKGSRFYVVLPSEPKAS